MAKLIFNTEKRAGYLELLVNPYKYHKLHLRNFLKRVHPLHIPRRRYYFLPVSRFALKRTGTLIEEGLTIFLLKLLTGKTHQE